MMKKLISFIIISAVLIGGFLFLKNNDILTSKLPSEPENNYNGFFYSHLDTKEKISYELIMKKLYDFPEKIAIPRITDKNLDNIFEAILYDNVDIFFLSDTCKTSSSLTNDYFIPSYSITKDDYQIKLNDLNKKCDKIIEQTQSLKDDYSKELYIHDYIVNNCEYIEKTGGDYSSPYGCLINGSASCEGYARSAKLLFDRLGIENYFAMGNFEQSEENKGHIWNIVKIENEYYHLDCTWDDPKDEKLQVRYTYFNLPDDEILISHEPEERFMGKCSSTAQNYYVKNKLSFDSYDDTVYMQIRDKLSQAADNNNSIFSFKFTNKNAYDDALTQLFEKEKIYRLLSLANIQSVQKKIKVDKISYLPDDDHFIIKIVNFLN